MTLLGHRSDSRVEESILFVIDSQSYGPGHGGNTPSIWFARRPARKSTKIRRRGSRRRFGHAVDADLAVVWTV
ncbi:hypothetical protein MHYP_G00356020 [Metynnis hypsauchen]